MRRRGEKGFTLVEITIIVLVLAILGAILLPMAEEYIDLARLARVREDIGLLVAVIEKFKYDTCDSFFKVDGDGPNTADNRIDMLVSDGDIPAINGGYRHPHGGRDGMIENWQAPVGKGALNVDTIENHLALGDPYGHRFGDPYRRPGDKQDLYDRGGRRRKDSNPFTCGWRGAYLQTPVLQDPWGNRYAINVAFLGPGGHRNFGLGRDFSDMDVFVLSAGPDETVETPWAVDGVVAQGDDQIAVVSGGSLF